MTLSKLDKGLGAQLVGILVSSLLFGVTVMQAHTFFTTTSPQELLLLFVVAFVMLSEIVHTITSWAWIYYLTVNNFGNMAAIVSIHWTFVTCMMAYTTTYLAVQFIFTYRIFVISGSWWQAAPLWLLESCCLVDAIGFIIASTMSDGFLDFQKRFGYLVYIGLITSVVVDMMNAGLLCWHLWDMRNGIPGTYRVVKRVALFAVETGVVQAIVALITLTLWLLCAHSGFWVAAILIESKVYPIALLTTLNARLRLRTALHKGTLDTSTAISHSCSLSLARRKILDGQAHISMEPIIFANREETQHDWAQKDAEEGSLSSSTRN